MSCAYREGARFGLRLFRTSNIERLIRIESEYLSTVMRCFPCPKYPRASLRRLTLDDSHHVDYLVGVRVPGLPVYGFTFGLEP